MWFWKRKKPAEPQGEGKRPPDTPLKALLRKPQWGRRPCAQEVCRDTAANGVWCGSILVGREWVVLREWVTALRTEDVRAIILVGDTRGSSMHLFDRGRYDCLYTTPPATGHQAYTAYRKMPADEKERLVAAYKNRAKWKAGIPKRARWWTQKWFNGKHL